MARKFKRPKWIRQYHRWLGVAVAFPWIWLALTGLLLRQQENLSLNTRVVHSKPLLQHYGVWPSEPPITFQVAGTKNQFVTLWGDALYKDGHPLGYGETLTGAAACGPHLAVASDREVSIYDAQLEFYDKLDEITLGVASLQSLGAGTQQRPVLYQSEGKRYSLSQDYLSSQPVRQGDIPNAQFSAPADLPAALVSTIERHYASDVGISWARLLLDLHSGNFFGPLGKLIIDLSALLSIVLTVLGLLLIKRKPKAANPSS